MDELKLPKGYRMERRLVAAVPDGYKERIEVMGPAPKQAYISYEVSTLLDDLFVVSLWVSEEMRRQGWGSLLLQVLASTYPNWPTCLHAVPSSPMSFEDLDRFYVKAGFYQPGEGSLFCKLGTPGWKPLPPADKGPIEYRIAAERLHQARRPR